MACSYLYIRFALIAHSNMISDCFGNLEDNSFKLIRT